MLCEVIGNTDLMSRNEWLDLRSTGLGGSDCSAIFGVSRYTSRYSLWAEKTGAVERSTSSNEAMEWGNLLESVVAEKFAREYDAAVVSWPMMLKSKSHPFMLANLDFLIVEPSKQFPAGKVTKYYNEVKPEGIINILEIKTTGIVGKGNARGWEDDFIPRNYELQGLHYSCVTGIETVVFAALVAGEGLVVRGRLYGDEERFDCMKRESAFWELIKTNTSPDPDGNENTLETLGKMYPKHKEGITVQASDFIMETYTQYVKTKAELDEVEGRLKELRAHLQIAIGEGEAMEYNGATIFTYKANKDGEAFDSKAFKEANPELYAKFVKPRKGARVLRIKGE